MTSALEARDITKRFPGTLANDGISIDMKHGEIHAILGENGAGKTTLMNIIYGLYRQDSGLILVDDRVVDIHNPHDAIRLGIGMVHQHFMLIPVFTVAENIVLGIETTHAGIMLDGASASARIRALSQQYGLAIDPDVLVKDLPVGIQQRVEIIKALYRQANILILDEPTAVLTPQESDDLFRIMRELAQRGVSIIFITHKLREVLAVADRITVLRNGRVVGTTKPGSTDEAHLAAMMVGREVLLRVEKGQAKPGDVVLSVRNLRVRDAHGHDAIQGVSFDVRSDEILGIAGVQGNGQTELVECLAGLRAKTEGRVTLAGIDVTHATTRQMINQGMAHVPEDRQEFGIVLSDPIADNLVLCSFNKAPFTSHGFILNHPAIEENAKRLVEQYDIRTPSVYTRARSLSGGNQQKVVVARELSRPIKLLVVAQPTRGLDVGSIEFIHKRIVEQRDAGVAVLLVSAELDEITALSDRIAVMYRGRILDVVDAATTTREQLGLLMAGVKN